MIDENEVLHTALEIYGNNAQINQLHEEMAELIIAINKQQRGKDDEFHIAEEIADVKIMLEQMIMLFDCAEQVQLWYSYKIERLAQRLNMYPAE